MVFIKSVGDNLSLYALQRYLIFFLIMLFLSYLFSLLRVFLLLVVLLCMFMVDMNITVALPYEVTVESIYWMLSPFFCLWGATNKLYKPCGVSVLDLNVNSKGVDQLSEVNEAIGFTVDSMVGTIEPGIDIDLGNQVSLYAAIFLLLWVSEIFRRLLKPKLYI
jgi:hypothetical protein